MAKESSRAALSRTMPITQYFFRIPQSHDPVTHVPASASAAPLIYKCTSVEPKLYHRLPVVLIYNWIILSKKKSRIVAHLCIGFIPEPFTGM